MGRSFENRKHAMAKTAAMKTKVYSKYGKEIYVVAKSGGPDPDGNLALRSLIDKAKKDQVPAHVIEKAIQKAEGGGGEEYQPAQYEGYGPGKAMFIIDCLTDNVTRTIADIRHAFTRVDCKIGSPGSVAHMFDHLAVLGFKGQDEEAVLEALMEADVDVKDIEEQGEMLVVLAPNTEYFAAKKALEDAFEGIEFDVDDIQWVPQTTVPVEGEDAELLEKFLDILNDNDDVQNVYHNAELN